MGDLNVQQRKFVVKAGMTVDDVKNSKEATVLQKKYASAFDTDGTKDFSQKEADLFNATSFAEKADGTVTFWTRQKDGTKKGTKFNSNDNNIQFKSEDEVKPYVKKVAVKKAAQKKEESVSFFDEKWSGHQISRLTGDNAITDWLQDKDKVCTDGKDDGKIGFWEGTKSLVKGIVGGIPKAIINHPVATIATIGVCAAATALTGGAILPVLGAIGVATGVGMAGYGGYKALTAKTDGEAKQALETLGMGLTTTALSVAAADKALEKAAEAGVKSAQVSEDAGIIDKTIQMFKAIPESLTKSKEWTLSFIKGTPVNIELADGTKQVKVKGNLVEETFENGSYRKYDSKGSVTEELVIRDNSKAYYKNGIIQEETLADGTYRKYNSKIEGLVIEEKLPDGTYNITSETSHYRPSLSKHVDHGFGDYTKIQQRDGSYKIIDNKTGTIVEEHFTDGTYTSVETSEYRSSLSKYVKHGIGDYTKIQQRDGSYKIINNKTGNIVEEELPNGGYRLYDADGLLTKGKVIEGNKTSVFEDGKLVSTREELPNGGYKLYDADGLLTKGKVIEGNKTSVFEDGKLVSTREELQNGGYKLYDADGLLTKGKVIEGNKTSIFEDGKLVSTREELPNGGYKLYDVKTKGTEELVIKGKTSKLYQNGNLVEETLADGTYRKYSTKTPGRIITEKTPDGARIDRYIRYSGKNGDFTKTTLKDGSYKVINNETGKIVEEIFADGGYKKYDFNGNILEQKTGEEVAKELEVARAAAKTAREARKYAAKIAERESSSTSSYSESGSGSLGSFDRLPDGTTPHEQRWNGLDGNTSHSPIYAVEDCPSLARREYLESLGYKFCNYH